MEKNRVCVNQQLKNGRTALHFAVFNDNVELVRFLISFGADIDVQDNLGNTPMHGCISIEMAKLMLESGAKLDVYNQKGQTPFHIWTHRSDIDLILFFFKEIGERVERYDEEYSEEY